MIDTPLTSKLNGKQLEVEMAEVATLSLANICLDVQIGIWMVSIHPIFWHCVVRYVEIRLGLGVIRQPESAIQILTISTVSLR